MIRHDAPQTGRRARLLLSSVLLLLVPFLAGGCPDFRNGVVDAVDAATRSYLFSTAAPDDIVRTTAESIVNSALDLFFDQFRTDSVR